MFIVSALGFEHSTAWKSFRIFWLMYRSAISLPTVCLPTYIALYVHVLSYMYMVHYVYVHMFVHNCISRCRHELFIWWAHAQPESREKKNKKKTWKRKYKQRTKTNTKKSTINNKKKSNRRHSVYWPKTDRVPLHRWIAFFLLCFAHAQIWGMWGESIECFRWGREGGG